LGSQYQLRLTLDETDFDAVANTSEVAWDLRVRKLSGSGFFTSSSSPWSVVFGATTIASGSLGSYDFRGITDVVLGSGTRTVGHFADGTLRLGAAGVFTDGGAIGSGTVSASYLLSTLTRLPGVPSSVVGTRISDTSVSVGWAQSSASNGQPTSNTIRRSVNGSAFANAVTISPATSVTLDAAANQKIVYGVQAANTAGATAFSASSTPIYTTPAAPSSVAAAKTASLNIDVAWTPNVAYVEHQHLVEFSTNAGSSWSALATVSAGVSTHTHVAPDAALVHVYRVRAVTTAAPTLSSANVTSNSVQLLAAPNAPTLPALPAFANRGAAFVLPWTHNPVDTTPQTAFEVQFSTDGGSSWTSTGKITSTVPSRTVTAATYTANQAVTMRVRTWGQATTGGAESTGASPWSAQGTVTFKTLPVASIVSPVDAVNYVTALLDVQLGFSQAEAATFVDATIELREGSTSLETITTTTSPSTLFDTSVENGVTYTVRATVRDSNGLVSALVSRTFSVVYTLPVSAGVTVTYLPDSGIAQIGLTFPTPPDGRVAATSVTIRRSIGGVRETVAASLPVAGAAMTVLDATPTINGVNTYTVRSISADGATADVTAVLTTAELVSAFFSAGAGFGQVVSFFGDLRFAATPTRDTALVQAAGRVSPIALFGVGRGLQVAGSATLLPDRASSGADVEKFLLGAGIVCYRDPSGRRMFGTLSVVLDSLNSTRTAMQYTMTEAT